MYCSLTAHQTNYQSSQHWLAYSIENYNNVTRLDVDVNVSEYDLAHTYMPAWEMLVKEGQALGIMCR